MKRIALFFFVCGLGFAVGRPALPVLNASEPQSFATTSSADSRASATASVLTPAASSEASTIADPGNAEAQWLTSVPEAQALAQKENKLVLVDFTGSDWCVWCKRLDAEVFSKSEFANYARKHLVLVQLDFPSQKPQSQSLKDANQALMHKYNVDGFPTLVVMKPGGTVVWKQDGYLAGGPSAMIAKLDEVRNK